MISYDNYLNRIKKLAKAKKFFHKFRFLFIGLFSAIIATSAGLLIAKGAVTTAMTLPAQIPFGETYSPTPASAFLSPVSYEYRLEEGGEWTSEKPYKSGKYLARTVTERSFGTKGYGEPVRFEILKKQAEFNIGADEVVYGDVPAGCEVKGLVFGQKLISRGLQFIYKSYASDVTEVTVDPASVRITDLSGNEDYSSCYELTCNPKTLKILPRTITAKPLGRTVEYTGDNVLVANAVSADTEEQLAAGDKITVTNSVTNGAGEEAALPRDAGNYPIEIMSLKIMKGDIDVTQRYSVHKDISRLIINSRTVRIKTVSKVKEYDGEFLSGDEEGNNRNVIEGLIEGHRAELAAGAAYPTLIKVGTVSNAAEFRILDRFGNDITRNYSIVYDFGTLEVTKRHVKLKTPSASKEYDGTPLKAKNEDISVLSGTIFARHHMVISDYSITNVWESGKNYASVTVLNDAGTDVTEFYDISYEYGDLTVTGRRITVKTAGATEYYSGAPIVNSSFSVTAGSLLKSFNHRLVASDLASITDVGEKPNAIVFTVLGGYEDVTGNYIITPDWGTLKVLPRPITVTTITPANPHVYDGAAYFDAGYETKYFGDPNKEGLVGGDKLEILSRAEITDVGTVTNELVFSAGSNYDVKQTLYGKLTVVPRPIVVKTNSASKVYDGSPLFDGGYTTYYKDDESAYGLLNGDALRLVGSPAQIKDVGEISNTCAYESVSGNYVLVTPYVYGTLTVTARPIEVELLSVTATYGETPVYPAGEGNILNAASCNLAAGEKIEVSVTFEGVEDGKFPSVGDYVISAVAQDIKINGVLNNQNYTVTEIHPGVLHVVTRAITVKTEGDSKIYDGEGLHSPSFSVVNSTPAAGDEVYFTDRYEIYDVLESGSDETVFYVRNSAGDCTSNYEISYDYGYLEVTARPLTVTTNDAEKVYDGNPLKDAGYMTHYFGAPAKAGLLGGDLLSVNSEVTLTDVGEVPNACVYGAPSNYEIKEVIPGSLKVNVRKIKVTTKSAEKVYDSLPLTCDGYDTEYFDLINGDTYGATFGLAAGDTLTLSGEAASITDKGEIPNSNRYTSNSNYEIAGYGEDGTLTVTVRRIVVETGSDEKVYDGAPLTCTDYKTYYYGNYNKTGLIASDGGLTLVGEPASVTNYSPDGVTNICAFALPSENYEIAHYAYGTLKIKQKSLNVVLSNVEDVTYGQTLSYPSGAGNFANPDSCGLVNGETMQLAVTFYSDGYVTPKNAGGYVIAPDLSGSKIYDKNGGEIADGYLNYYLDENTVSVRASILPKTVSVLVGDARATYGDSYTVNYTLVGGSEYGEHITPAFIFENSVGQKYNAPARADVYSIGLNTQSFAVTDADGNVIENGADNYAFVHGNDATLTIIKRAITVKIADVTAEYGDNYDYPDGAGNFADPETCDLAFDDTLEVFVNLPKAGEGYLDVGTYEITAIDTAALINGENDLSCYDITYLPGSLIISQRKIYVQSNSAKRPYNGDPLKDGGYTTYSYYGREIAGLLGDDVLQIVGGLPEITDVGRIRNTVTYAAGGNYQIMDTLYGWLEVAVRKIVIASASGTWVYDGQPHSMPSMDEDESYHLNGQGEKEPALVKDHRFIAGAYPEITDVGTVFNVCYDNEIVDGEGNPVPAGNYEIDGEASGKLTVTARPIVVITADARKPYDGQPLFDTGYVTYYDKNYNELGEAVGDKPATDNEYGEGDKEGLVNGDGLTLVGDYASVTNVYDGKVPNLNVYASPVGEYGNANYEIKQYILGGLEVIARLIMVKLDDITVKYGESYAPAEEVDNYKNYADINLAEGEKLQVAAFYRKDDETVTPKGVGTYEIHLSINNSKIFVGGLESVRGIENYQIICPPATLEIEKKNILIRQNDITAVYGDGIEYNGFTPDEVLPYGEQLTMQYFFTDLEGEPVSGRLRCGKYFVCANEDSVRVDGELNVNYTFEYANGLLEITQRHIEVQVGDLTAAYGDGYEYSSGAGNFKNAEDCNLAYDDTLEISVTINAGEQPFAGEYSIVADETATVISGTGDLSDYVIEYVDGTLEITPREVKIELFKNPFDVVYGNIYSYPASVGNYKTVDGYDLAYGERVQVYVSYFLNGARVTTPKNVGEYEVRLATPVVYDKNGDRVLGGDKNYLFSCEPVALKVVPAKLTVTIDDSSYVYGDDAPEITFTAEGLVFDEEITLTYIYMQGDKTVQPENAGEYSIYTDKSLALINGGKDGVGNYEIKFNVATLTILQRHIKVETNTSSHTYDGNPYSDIFVKSVLSADGEGAGFVNGYQPEVDLDSVPSVTTVAEGEIPNEFVFTVSDNYVVDEVSYGKIKITQADLYITLDSYSKIYGEEFTYPAEVGNYAGADGLVEGETLQVTARALLNKAVPDVGVYKIVADETKTLINGGDYSNYNLHFTDGELTVTVRRIIILSASGEWVYDGKPHSKPSENPDDSYYLDADGKKVKPALVEGHSFVAGEYPTITEVGRVINTCYGDGSKVIDADGNPVKEGNYELVDMGEAGVLVVTRRDLMVNTGSLEAVYDGEYHSTEELTVESGYELPEGQSLQVDRLSRKKNVSESGENRTTYNIIITATGEIVSKSNFRILQGKYGRIEITRREIDVYTHDAEKVYDGKPLEKPLNPVTYLHDTFGETAEEGLIKKTREQLTLTYTASITNVGSAPNDCEYAPNGNYRIMKVVAGTLTVTERHITVVTKSATKIYDGDYISAAGYEKTYLTENSKAAGLVNGDVLTLADGCTPVSIKDVGEEVNVLEFTASANYIIDGYEYGTVSVTKRPLVITTADADKIYDGSPLSDDSYTDTIQGSGEKGLLDGDVLTVTKTATLTEVGEKPNACEYEVPNGNYEIVDIVEGTLKVTPRKLTIVLNDVEAVDYGGSLVYAAGAGNYISADGLVGDEILEVGVKFLFEGNVTDPKNAGGYTYEIDLENTSVTGTENGIYNYEVECVAKNATINKLAVEVTLGAAPEKVYDGEIYDISGIEISVTDGGTAYGEEITPAYAFLSDGALLEGVPSDAGEYAVKLAADECLIGGISADTNYILTCPNEATAKITPAPFTVTLEDMESVYDGEEYDFAAGGGFNVSGLMGDDGLSCNVKFFKDGVETPPVNAGEYVVKFDTANVEFANGNPSNYELDYEGGSYESALSITRRSIDVKVTDREIELSETVDPADESYKATRADGRAAFVGDDEENADATYYYDGNLTPPTATGRYNINVKFLRDEVMANYDVTVTQGYLTIVGRRVLVTPVYTGGAKVYDGLPIDVETLISEGKLSYIDEHIGKDLADDDKYGFRSEDKAGLTVTYEFQEATPDNNGIKYTDGAAPKNAGSYWLTVKIGGYDEKQYNVTSDRAIDYVIIEKAILNIYSVGSDEKQYDKKSPAAVEIAHSGLVEADEGDCAVVPAYYTVADNGTPTPVGTPYHVGTYKIGAQVYDPEGGDNYQIVCPAEVMGTLTITPVTLYIKPASKSEYYAGRNLYLEPSDYLFVDGEGGAHSGLVVGDYIKILASSELDPSRTAVAVTIKEAKVYDRFTGEDVTGDYVIKTSYDRSLMGSEYNSGDFRATLEYKLRTVHYKQIVPEGQGVFAYDGSVKTVTGNPLYEIVDIEGDQGLYGNDRIKVTTAKVGPQVGEYYDWLKLRVESESGTDLSRVYNLVLTNAAESFITVGVLDVKLTVDPSLTEDMLSDGSAFYTSRFDERFALDTKYYSLEGLMSGHTAEIVAIKSQGVWNLAVTVFLIKDNGSLSDVSGCYNLITEIPETLGVNCALIDYHQLSNIKSDITFTLKASYEELEKGENFVTTYDGRNALSSSQYTVEGLLNGHISEAVVMRSGGKITIALLAFEPKYTNGALSGRSDRSYNYNLVTSLPADFGGDINVVLVSSLSEVKQDIELTFNVSAEDIENGTCLEETFDGRLAVKPSCYTVEGLMTGHEVQVIAIKSEGKTVLATLVFEPKYTGGVLSGRSTRSYLYNLIAVNMPEGAEINLYSSLNEIKTEIRVTLSDELTYEKIGLGEATSASEIDGRRILNADMYTVENNFGVSPLAANHKLEIIVDAAGDGTYNLYVIVYQLTSSGKRSDRSYLYGLSCAGKENISVIYKQFPLGNEGL